MSGRIIAASIAGSTKSCHAAARIPPALDRLGDATRPAGRLQPTGSCHLLWRNVRADYPNRPRKGRARPRTGVGYRGTAQGPRLASGVRIAGRAGSRPIRTGPARGGPGPGLARLSESLLRSISTAHGTHGVPSAPQGTMPRQVIGAPVVGIFRQSLAAGVRIPGRRQHPAVAPFVRRGPLKRWPRSARRV